MSNFTSILKTIGATALGIEHLAAPIVSVMVPGSAPVFAAVDAITSRLQGSIVTAEANEPREKMGPLKARVVSDDLAEMLQPAQIALGKVKQKLVWDEAVLQEANAAQVLAYNKYAAFQASFKVEAL